VRFVVSAFLIVFSLLAEAPTVLAQGEKRIALVVGNSAYQHTGKLPNPGRDAQLIADTLKGLGFAVDLILDADQNSMKRGLLEFGRKLRDSGAVGLFYYAGHGMQVGGRNYLIPVSANIQDETEVGIESVSLDEFTATMERPGNPVNILILDACRNNPFPRAFRSTGGGLAPSDAPRGTYLAYATAPGAVASDGTSGNSPYTSALARAMQAPGLSIEEVFKQTRRDVLTQTKGQQTPWESSSITGNFSFKSGPPAAAAPADGTVEVAFWNSIKDADNRAAFEAYLAQFPNGSFAALARIKVAELPALAKQVAVVLPPASASPAATATRGKHQPLLPQSAARELADGDTAGLSCDQLWVARNEMFLRHGYCFETPRALATFGNDGCRTTKQDILTAIERSNARTLRAAEVRRQCDVAAASTTAVVATGAAPRSPAASAGSDCDRLAGAPWDGDLASAGVEFAALDVGRAVAACQTATAEAPNERRYLFQLGRAQDKARDYAAAKQAYQKAASLGSAAAMVNLGILYDKGQGVPKSAQEARGYFEKAARAGGRMGAFCYATVLDSAADTARAIEWYTRAAELGHTGGAAIARRLQTRPQPTGTKCD
jgi:tetratricopeptide (TPR) repeat protein